MMKLFISLLFIYGIFDACNNPNQYSLKGYCPEVRSQENYGTSPAYATIYYAMTISYAVKNQLLNEKLVTQNAFCPYQENRNGAVLTNIFKYLKEAGVPQLKDIAQPQKAYWEKSELNMNHTNKIESYTKIYSFRNKVIDDSGVIELFKRSLTDKKPIIIGFNCPNSFYYAKKVWLPSHNENPQENYGGHAMCVIGYDDTLYGGAFEIVNSWGKAWGNEGFCYIKYNDFVDYVKYGYVIEL
jgi:C1A family cysteine protease